MMKFVIVLVGPNKICGPMLEASVTVLREVQVK